MREAINRFWRIGLRVAWFGAWAWFQITGPRLRAAAVLVLWEGRVLAIQNSYKKGPGLPGGMLKRGEEPILGALRELREEVGLTLSPEDLRDRGFVTEKLGRATVEVHLFEWRPEIAPEIRIDEREIIAAEFETLEALGRKLPRFKATLDQLADSEIG